MVRLPTAPAGGGGAAGRATAGGGAAGRNGAVGGAAGAPSPPSPGLARSVMRTVSFFKGTAWVLPSGEGGGTGDGGCGGWVSSDMVMRGKNVLRKRETINSKRSSRVNEFLAKSVVAAAAPPA